MPNNLLVMIGGAIGTGLRFDAGRFALLPARAGVHVSASVVGSVLALVDSLMLAGVAE
jgi:hypothetical protein